MGEILSLTTVSGYSALSFNVVGNKYQVSSQVQQQLLRFLVKM